MLHQCAWWASTCPSLCKLLPSVSALVGNEVLYWHLLRTRTSIILSSAKSKGEFGETGDWKCLRSPLEAVTKTSGNMEDS